MSHPGAGGFAAQQNRKRQLADAIKSFGVIVQVKPETFLDILEMQENPLILEALGSFLGLRKHYRYVTSYKGLTFFTKCYRELNLPENSESIKVGLLEIPHEDFTIY